MNFNNNNTNFMTNAAQQQRSNVFGNTNNNTNFLNNNTNTPNMGATAMFNNQANNNTMFGNQNQTVGGNQGNNLFGGPNNNQGNLFGGSNNNNNNNSMLGNNQPGNNMFGNNQGNNMFGNNQGGNNNMFNNTGNSWNNNNNTGNSWNNNNNNNSNLFNNLAGINQAVSLQITKSRLEECMRRINTRNVQVFRFDTNIPFKDTMINTMQTPLKQGIMELMYNFKCLDDRLKAMKKKGQQINSKLSSFTKEIRTKLASYKKCLLQSVSHNKMIEELQREVNAMSNQVEEYLKPIYNAYQSKKKITVKQPTQFDLKVSYDILNKLQILNQRVDDMIACQTQGEQDQMQTTVAVFEQLIQYYQNVSCSFNQFSYIYNQKKRQAVEKQRKGSYEDVMNRVTKKVEENLKKQFKYYDLIKQIDNLLIEKDRRQERKIAESEKYTGSFKSPNAF